MNKTNSLCYLIIGIIFLIVIIHHFKYNKNIKKKVKKSNTSNTSNINEGFENNENVIIGDIVNYSLGNPKLPRNIKQIELKNPVANFKNKDKDKDKDKNKSNRNKKIYLDNNENGIKLHKNGSIIINFNKPVFVNFLEIKGLHKFRVDGSNEIKNRFIPIFTGKIKSEYLNKLNVFSNFNSENNKFKKIKITNLDNIESRPIKLEIYGEDAYCNYSVINEIKHLYILDENKKEINHQYYIDKSNIDSCVLEVKLDKLSNINGFSFKTNVPKFTISLSKDNEEFKTINKIFEGGVDGLQSINYNLPEFYNTDTIKIIPFINTSDNNTANQNYFIKDIKIFESNNLNTVTNLNNNKTNKNLKENFDNNRINILTREKLSDILNDEFQDATELHDMCKALEYQENIDNEKIKMEKFKDYYLKLREQEKEIKELEKTISELKNTRSEEIQKSENFKLTSIYNKYGSIQEAIDKLDENMDNKEHKNISINLISS